MTALFDRRQCGHGHEASEVFEIQPIILGGDPTDPANKIFLTREQHIQAVRYWNKTIRNNYGDNYELQ